ncbi:zinc finger BED domain-containing protein 6-like [Chanos chanos]|uniref:Zinc finger BED domain-containing protein 6-like n=1 Tax=Chanos chanos TaxID=29144 RepID=A0A6J2VLA5_CHACN|nr:zinc finger BED domain-containing protein 6-like [Chanos chanos]
MSTSSRLHWTPEIAKTADAARRVVSHFRHSAAATSALKKRQEQFSVKEIKKGQNDCVTHWNSTFVMLERLCEQRIPAQAALADETITKPQTHHALTLRASQWELLEHPLPVLRPFPKATTFMCAQLYVGLSFIYPVTDRVLMARESDMAAIRSFKKTVQQQLVTRFKLDSEGLAESVPVVACVLDPCFKDMQFLPEKRPQSTWLAQEVDKHQTVAGNRSSWRKPTQTRGERANSTTLTAWPGIEHETVLPTAPPCHPWQHLIIPMISVMMLLMTAWTGLMVTAEAFCIVFELMQDIYRCPRPRRVLEYSSFSGKECSGSP